MRRTSRAGIRGRLRRVQPVHLPVEPGPQERAFFTQQFGVALEAVLLVNGVQRMAPGKSRRRFEPGQRRFQA